MKRPLVLGIGNPLRGDDGFGAAVVEALERAGFAAHADLHAVHQLTPELVLELKRASCVAFVDAAVDVAPGTTFEHEPCADRGALRSSHHFDPHQLLTLTELFEGAAPPARVFGVGAEQFHEAGALSAVVRASVPGLADRIAAWCAEVRA